MAEAVTASLKSNIYQHIAIDKFESITGKGVVVNHNNKVYLVGNQNLLADYKVIISETSSAQINNWQNDAKTVVCLPVTVN